MPNFRVIEFGRPSSFFSSLLGHSALRLPLLHLPTEQPHASNHGQWEEGRRQHHRPPRPFVRHCGCVTVQREGTGVGRACWLRIFPSVSFLRSDRNSTADAEPMEGTGADGCDRRGPLRVPGVERCGVKLASGRASQRQSRSTDCDLARVLSTRRLLTRAFA